MLENIKFNNNKPATFFGQDLQEIAKKFKTPTFVYSLEQIANSYREIEKSFIASKIKNFRINYAIKANNNHDILKFISLANFAKVKIGADIVSKGEFEVAVRNGFDPSSIVFSGIGKSIDDINYTISKKIGQINIESCEEYFEIINKFSSDDLKNVNLVLRIKPDVDIGGVKKIATGNKDDKFGIAIDQAKEILQKTDNKISGLAIHIGSQILDPNKFETAFERLADLINFAQNLGNDFKLIDLGGGFGIPYQVDDKSFDFKIYTDLIEKILLPVLPKTCLFQFEPGRYIVADSGLILTKVIRVKCEYERNFAIIDCGMNNMLRPALYGSKHNIIKLDCQKNNPKKAILKYDIVGPICESSDFYCKDHSLASLEVGDYLAILHAGAYCRVMANDYNSLGLAAEVIIAQKQKVYLSRRQINHNDLDHFYSNFDL